MKWANSSKWIIYCNTADIPLKWNNICNVDITSNQNYMRNIADISKISKIRAAFDGRFFHSFYLSGGRAAPLNRLVSQLFHKTHRQLCALKKQEVFYDIYREFRLLRCCS